MLLRTKILWIYRGLPGSGKSTAARKHGCIVIEPQDQWATRDGVYDWREEEALIANNNAKDMVGRLMSLGYDIAIAETLPKKEDVHAYIELAEYHSYEVRVNDIKVTIDVAFERCVHGVPMEHLERMQKVWEDWV